jgi:hypothetical protein
MASKADFARKWYELGVCPGCGSPLEDVAGKGIRHSHNHNHPRIYVAGTETGPEPPGYVCPWSADDLAALVHIGSGMVYGGGTGNAALVRERRAPVIAPAIVSEGGNK